MSEQDKLIVKNSYALTRYDPKARKELVVRGLNALAKIIDADFYFFKGEEYRIKGELKQAIEYYEKALQINPEHEDSLFWMGYSFMRCVEERAGDDLEFDNTIRNERAALAFQKLIEVKKKNNSIGWSSYVVYYNLGLVQYHLDLYDKATMNLKLAVELNPEYADSYDLLGEAQYLLNLYWEAIESFEYAIELNPNDGFYYYMLGLVQYHVDLYEEATENLKRAVELNPNHANSYGTLGLSQEKLGLYHLAINSFKIYLAVVDHELSTNQERITYAKERIIDLEEMIDEDYFFSVGLKFWEKGQYQEAIECNEKAIEINPGYAKAYYNLALAQEELGIYQLAMDNFVTYLSLDGYEITDNFECIEYAKKRVAKMSKGNQLSFENLLS